MSNLFTNAQQLHAELMQFVTMAFVFAYQATTETLILGANLNVF